jgi:2-haloacid dehalogenase
MIKTIIFDLGGVLIDWNPKHLYRKIIKDEVEIDKFLAEVCTSDWNEEQDAGRSLVEATETLVKEHPEQEQNIRAFYGRWEEMLGGAIEESVEIFKKLKDSGEFKIYALTNWSSETYPIALRHYDFLGWFDGIVVSGDEKMRKPFIEFYNVLFKRYNVNPTETLFIDDNLRNIKAAEKTGMKTIHFTDPKKLNEQLHEQGISL